MSELIVELYRIGAIKFGEFTIKRDFVAPFQLDFSGVLAHPKIAKEICNVLWEKANYFSFEALVGGSIIASSLTAYLAFKEERALVIRKERGKNMTSNLVGSFKSGQKCLLIEDFLLSGAPTLDSLDDLREEGLEVKDVLCLIDMELGAKQKIKMRGFIPHAIFSMSDVLEILLNAGKLAGDAFKLSTDFLESVHTK